MTALRRAFVAVVPPPAVLDALADAVRDVDPAAAGLRVLPVGQWHVTVEFLGRVEDECALVGGLRAAVGGLVPFDAEVTGAGAFPTARRATVVWLRVGGDGIARLADAVTRCTRALGYASDRRPFHAHLTVARSSRPRKVDEVVAGLAAAAGAARWTVDDVRLVDSETRPSGAVHTERHRLALGG